MKLTPGVLGTVPHPSAVGDSRWLRSTREHCKRKKSQFDIDSSVASRQFHQHNARVFRMSLISAAFSCYMYVVKAAKTYVSYNKFVLLTLMKLTIELTFINVLCTAFTRAESKSVKKDSQVASIFFCFFRSVRVKAVNRTMMELSLKGMHLQPRDVKKLREKKLFWQCFSFSLSL